ncbi:MAG: type II secretion system protein [Clostridia bacterium]|nr:type II secretion system protein [Clostridia bacterium]
MKKSSKKGFTLIELVVTIGLFSIVGTLCATLIFIGIRHSRQNAERSAFQIGVNKFVAIVNNHVNSGGNGDISVTVNGDQVEIEIISRSDKQIYNFNEETKQLLLSEDGGEVIIAPYVKDVDFSYDTTKKLLNIKVQSDFDDGWLETSFYIR